MGSVRDKIFNK